MSENMESVCKYCNIRLYSMEAVNVHLVSDEHKETIHRILSEKYENHEYSMYLRLKEKYEN